MFNTSVIYASPKIENATKADIVTFSEIPNNKFKVEVTIDRMDGKHLRVVD